MFSLRKVTYFAFIGAALLFVLPSLFFLEISTFQEVIGILLQFALGWIFLGISLFYHSNFYLKSKKRIHFFGLSLILFSVLTISDILLSLALENSTAFEFPRRAPIVPETIIQNVILSIVSIAVVYQDFQSKKNEEDRLRIIKLENENLQLQLNSLQQQLNPHFFFNSLNTLSELIYTDVEKSEAYINELSQVFRYILDMQRKPLVDLAKELKFIQSYFFLLKIRYDDKLNLHCDIEQSEPYKIPSLSLLVLFENVIKHNAITAEKPMNISMEIEGTYLIVKNNKNRLHLKPHSFGIGLENLSNRCLLLTDQNCIIEDGVHYFTVKTPLIKDENYHN